MTLNNTDLLCYGSGGQEFEIGLIKQGCVSSENFRGECVPLPFPDSRAGTFLDHDVLPKPAVSGQGFLILYQSDTFHLLSFSFLIRTLVIILGPLDNPR